MYRRLGLYLSVIKAAYTTYKVVPHYLMEGAFLGLAVPLRGPSCRIVLSRGSKKYLISRCGPYYFLPLVALGSSSVRSRSSFGFFKVSYRMRRIPFHSAGYYRLRFGMHLFVLRAGIGFRSPYFLAPQMMGRLKRLYTSAHRYRFVRSYVF